MQTALLYLWPAGEGSTSVCLGFSPSLPPMTKLGGNVEGKSSNLHLEMELQNEKVLYK